MNVKLSKVSFFLFLFSFNYLWLRVIFFNYFYNNFGNMCWIYLLILILLIFIILVIIPKDLFSLDYEKKYLKSKFKYLFNLLLAIEAFLGITISCQILKILFVNNLESISLLIVISIVIGIVSINKPSDIIQMSTIFFIVGLSLLVLSYIYYIDLDIMLLLPFEKKDMIGIPFLLIMLIGNNLNILLMDKKNFKLTKTVFILPIILSIIFLIFELLMLILTSGTELFSDVLWVGFISASIKPVAKYVGNFDFAYIIYILISCVFKFSYNFSVIRNSFKKNNNKTSIFYSLFLIIGMGIIQFYLPFDYNLIFISSGIIFLEILILIWYFKEYYYVRKIKKE